MDRSKLSNMTRLLILFLLITLTSYAQTEDMVCIPCGHPCDEIVVKGTGVCKTCQMPLVPKSTVKITNLSARDFCARITDNPDVVILDVRSTREFDGTSEAVATYGHFKKAININVNQLSKHLSELKPYKDKEILVYCSQSIRSPRAAYYLNMQGFSNVKNLTGGLSKAGAAFTSSCYKEHFVVHQK